MNLSEEAKEQRRKYKREWNKRNRDKILEHQRRYWENKAKKAREAKESAQ